MGLNLGGFVTDVYNGMSTVIGSVFGGVAGVVDSTGVDDLLSSPDAWNGLSQISGNWLNPENTTNTNSNGFLGGDSTMMFMGLGLLAIVLLKK